MPDPQDLTLAEAREAAPPLHRTLVAGLIGHDVARLQSDLHRAGLDPGTIDGVFGTRTTAALAAFTKRDGLPDPAGSVDAALWSLVVRAAAVARADAHEAVARAHEQAADAAHEAAAAAQKLAADKRAQAAPAGADEEQAAAALLDAAQQWTAVAARLLAAAAELAPHADPDARCVRAHARHLHALDLARAHARRAVNALAVAAKDFESAGVTDHRARVAATTLAARIAAAV